MNRIVRIVFAASLPLGSLVIACSGSVTDVTQPPGPSEFGQPTRDAGPDVVADAEAPILVEGDGSANQPPATGTPERKCYEATTKAVCRDCCHGLYADGRKVYTNAVDMCLCQPSLCGSQCARSLCNLPQSQPPAGDPCIKCFNAALAGTLVDGGAGGDSGAPSDAAADGGGSGNWKELGVTSCSTYAQEACRKSTDCVKAEQCKVSSQCNSKQ